MLDASQDRAELFVRDTLTARPKLALPSLAKVSGGVLTLAFHYRSDVNITFSIVLALFHATSRSP